ncbi:unnamed protein product [Ectocarpus sp. 12 AP-2014]
MSLVAKFVAPVLLVGSAGVGMHKSRPALAQFGNTAFAKGSVALTASIALQLVFIKRCAMGGRPSNAKGLMALIYPAALALSVAVSFMLFHNLPPMTVWHTLMNAPSRLGASGNHPVHQYRLNDVIDRVREIVGDRLQETSDDLRER